MDQFAALTGRSHRLFEYDGAPDAERVIVVMGSGAATVRATVVARLYVMQLMEIDQEEIDGQR